MAMVADCQCLSNRPPMSLIVMAAVLDVGVDDIAELADFNSLIN